jgi:hypothetical protein
MKQYTDKEIDEVRYLASCGWCEPDICKLLKITWREWERSKAKNAKLCMALNEGKANAQSYCKFLKEKINERNTIPR